MITETIIDELKNDSTLRTLLGASSANSAPIQAGFTRGDVESYLVAVGTVMGSSDETGYENGIITIEIYVKAGIDSPVKKATDIAKRIINLLDLKGSQLNDSLTSVVYRLRKTSFTMDFDDSAQCHVGLIDFEFYTCRTA
jgi:hypothetical protein